MTTFQIANFDCDITNIEPVGNDHVLLSLKSGKNEYQAKISRTDAESKEFQVGDTVEVKSDHGGGIGWVAGVRIKK